MILESKRSGVRITCTQEQYDKLRRGGTASSWKVISNKAEEPPAETFSLDFLLNKVIKPAYEDNDIQQQPVTEVLEEIEKPKRSNKKPKESND